MENGSETKFLIIDKIRNSALFKYFEEHTALVIAITSVIVTIGSLIIKLFEYLILKGRLSIYNIPIEYIKMDSPDSLTNFINRALMFIGVFIASAYAFKLLDFLKSTFSMQKEIIFTRGLKRFTKLLKLLLNSLLIISGLIIELLYIALINIGIFYLLVAPKYIEVFSWLQLFKEVGQLFIMEFAVVIFTNIFWWLDNASKKRRNRDRKTVDIENENVNTIDKKITKKNWEFYSVPIIKTQFSESKCA